MNKPAVLAILALITSIFEMLFHAQLGYDHPIPAIGFLLGMMAAMAYASYKSRPTEE